MSAASPLLARLEARKAEKENKTTDAMKAELEAKMNRASTTHDTLLKAKQDAAGKEVAKAKHIAETHPHSEEKTGEGEAPEGETKAD